MNTYFNNLDEYISEINNYIVFQIQHFKETRDSLSIENILNTVIEKDDFFCKHLEEFQLSFAYKTNESAKRGIYIPLLEMIKYYKLTKFEVHCIMIALTNEFNMNLGEQLKKIKINNDSYFPTVALAIALYQEYNSSENDLTFFNKLEKTFNIFFKNTNKEISLNTELILNDIALSALLDNEITLPFYMKLYSPKKDASTICETNKFSEILNIHKNLSYENVILLSGEYGIGKKFTLKQLSNMTSQNIIFINTSVIFNSTIDEVHNIFDEILKTAILYKSMVCFDKKDNADNFYYFHFINLHKEISKYNLRLFICKEKNVDDIFLSSVPFIEIKFNELSFNERKELFDKNLKDYSLDKNIKTKNLAAKFHLTPLQVISACTESKILSKNNKISSDSMYNSIYNNLTSSFGNLAEKIAPIFVWDDLVLPEQLIADIKQACNHIIYENTVYKDWNFDSKISSGQGLNILFTGLPGTGKTMLSQVIANELNMELYRIDLSSVVSKYIGETEKNLSKIFDSAKKSNSILFFDEMDSLFGKRSETEEANDKYANMETAYLLQKIDEYKGVVLMATNYFNNIDDAFIRRIHFIFHIPFPSEELRKTLWEKSFPKKAPLDKNIDFDYLAKFQLSGAVIKNISVSAAYYAAATTSKINMYCILKALKYELSKQGKILLKSDFKEYAYLLENEL